MNGGGKAYVHGSTELPDASSRPLPIPKSIYSALEFTALSIYSTAETRGLSVSQRQCRFLEESNLEIAPVYSYHLCRTECRMNYAKRLCGCVPHFYKHRDGFQVCSIDQWQCLAKHSELIIKLWASQNATRVVCNCLPSCDDTYYAFDDREDVAWQFGTEMRWGLTLYPRMRLKRDVLFGFTDLLVSIGGTAGLFLGCSVLSFMEFIYFFSLKLLCTIRNHVGETKGIRRDKKVRPNAILVATRHR